MAKNKFGLDLSEQLEKEHTETVPVAKTTVKKADKADTKKEEISNVDDAESIVKVKQKEAAKAQEAVREAKAKLVKEKENDRANKNKQKPGPKTNKKAQKPASDYLRLNLVTDEKNYKEYLEKVSEESGLNITKYIQTLIDKDMKRYNRKKTDTQPNE